VTGDRFQFMPKNLAVTAGEDVTIRLSSDDIAHDFYVKGVGHVVHAKAGQTARGGLRIDEPGTYKFWCTVANHKKAGMTGRITVT
jgi:heme/copper-type cytochrome/quinol oxidase subunit 2